MALRMEMEETLRRETEQNVVEDKEGEGIWAWVLATMRMSVVTSFIKVWGTVQKQFPSRPVKFEVLAEMSSRQSEIQVQRLEANGAGDMESVISRTGHGDPATV